MVPDDTSLTPMQQHKPRLAQQRRHGHRTSFAFRDSISSSISRAASSTMLFRDKSNSIDLLRKRYADSKHSSTTSASLPDYSNHELGGTPTAGMTTFLPTLHSTPPMPTFQKPGLHRESPTSTPTSNIKRRAVMSNNDNAPSPLSDMSNNNNIEGSQPPVYMRRRAAQPTDTNPENAPPKRIYIPHRNPSTIDGHTLSPGSSSGDRATRGPVQNNSHVVTTTPLIDRCPHSPELPRGWDAEVDRLICEFDAAGYDHARIVRKVREYFPQVRGVLMASMIDKRLRQLDQDLEVNYWRDALRSQDISVREERQARRARKEREREREEEPSEVRRQLGNQRHQNWSERYGNNAARGQGEEERPLSPGLRGGGGAVSVPRDFIDEEVSKDERAEKAGASNGRTVTRGFLTGFRSTLAK